MRKNIFAKSMVRQPMRTALLMLLIALSVFALTMRGAEYLVITNNIEEIGRYYRAVGFLTPTDPENQEVLSSAELVANSPLVAFEDRRRGFAGVLQDMLHSDVGPMSNVNAVDFFESLTDAFFYGELISKSVPNNSGPIELNILIDEVAVGFPEHVIAGQMLTLHFYPDERSEELFPMAWLNPFYRYGVMRNSSILDNMEIGQRYFFRAVYHARWSEAGMGAPQIGRESDVLALRPLNETATSLSVFHRETIGEELWYIPVAPGETVNFSALGLESLSDEFEGLRLNQSTIRLETTVDMTAVPYTQVNVGIHRIVEGRAIDRTDYEEARPVAVINDSFARVRGIQVGDTLTIGVPAKQYIVGFWTVGDIGDIMTTHSRQVGMPYQGQYEAMLELEVVGLYRYHIDGGWWTYQTTLIYVPDSLLPYNFIHQWLHDDTLQGTLGVDIQIPFWYSFVLHDPRDEDTFLLEYRDTLAAMGMNVGFIPTNAIEFWSSAEPILQSAMFNLVIFGGLAVLMLAFLAFLYLRQSRREFSILRALGIPQKIVFRQQVVAVFLVALPATIMGGVTGWFFALREAGNTLSPLLEIPTTPDTDPGFLILEPADSVVAEVAPVLPLYWLILFLILILTAVLLIVVIGSRRVNSRPVLELLQGNQARRNHAAQGTVAKQGSVETTTAPASHNILGGQTSQPLSVRRGNRAWFTTRFICRHLVRSKGKSILMVAVALFFIVALGYLQETIVDSEAEIERLYDTTAVSAEIRPTSLLPVMHRGVGNVIAQRTVEAILDSGFVRNVYIEAGQEYAVMIPAPDGILPENWAELAGIDLEENTVLHLDLFQPLLAFGDMDAFQTAHSRNFLDEMPGTYRQLADGRPMGDIILTFGPGFSEASFVFTEGTPIPMILSERVMEEQGMAFGDLVYLGTTLYDTRTWSHVKARVVGVHNRNINHIAHQLLDAALMPLEALESMLGRGTGYTTLSFEIAPAHSRDITTVRVYLEAITANRDAGFTRLELHLWDEELRMIAAPMEQNLSLLCLLYPVAIAVSILIGLGLSMLLMLQNAKNAAIMRVLGQGKRKTRTILVAEQVMPCLLGLLFGVGVLLLTGWGFGPVSALSLVAVYLTGSVVGGIVGAILVTSRPPLELLQVKE